MKNLLFVLLILTLPVNSFPQSKHVLPYLSIHVIDFDKETFRQVVVDREDGQYLGHPTTVLPEDGKIWSKVRKGNSG